MAKTRVRFWVKPNRSAIHLSLAILWTLLTIPAVLWWSESILYVILASNFANVYTAISAFEGSKAKEAVVESGPIGTP